MKKRFLYFLICISLTGITVSCKKGNTGPAGPQGPQGLVGPAGSNGSVIYSGTSAPSTSLGNVGDFYLDLTTGVLYGPKASSGWSLDFSMKGDTGVAGANGATGATGATGAAGQAGTQIYAGKNAPAPTLGAVGDFYMDTVTHVLYGPKLAAGWGLPIVLQGATGPAGPAGPAGTANVQYTPWFTANSWRQQTPMGIIQIYDDVAVPAVTSNIINNGVVLVFGELNDYITSIWTYGAVGQLPINLTYIYMGKTYEDEWQAIITSGNVRLQMTDNQNEFTSSSFAYSMFRCVVVPGGVSIPANISYKELKTWLHVNIPD